MKRFFWALAPLIFFTSCAPVFAQTQTFWNNVNIEGNLDVIINATVSKILSTNGTANAPSITFTNDPTSGLYLIGTGEVDIAAGGIQALDVLKIGSNAHFGFGAPAQGSGEPFAAVDTINGSSVFSYTNSSTGASSATILSVVNGTSGSNNTSVENHANHTTGPFAGGSAFTSGINQTQLSFAAEYSGAFMNFFVGGTNAANEIIRLNNNNMTVDNGYPIIMNGSSSGAVTIEPQAAAGTYVLKLPTSDAQGVLYSDASGNMSFATTGISSSGFVLTSNGGSAPTWQAAGTPTFSGLTTNALAVATSSSAISSLSSTGTAGQIIVSGGSSAVPGWQPPNSPSNFLVNGAFDWWQAGTSATVTASGGASPTDVYLYQADQWYVDNLLGGATTEGVITYSQQTGANDGSKFGAQIQITTAPNTKIGSWYVVQPLSNKASQALYNQTASFSILIKALNNINQVDLQFGYATSETKLASLIGSPVHCSVNSSTWTLCAINGQALGTSQTRSGVIGIRISPSGISSGSVDDLNNGFIMEQAMMNLGSVAMPFKRQFDNPTEELAACQYFYEVWGTGAATNKNLSIGYVSVANTTGFFVFPFKVIKRAVPTPTVSSASHFNAANASTNAAATGFSDIGCSVDTGVVTFTLSGTYAANSGLQIFTNSTSARIFFDARM